MMEAYPNTLPNFSWDGHSYADTSTAREMVMEAGPAETRQTVTQVPTIFTVRAIYTPDQMAYFEGWFKHILDNGVAWFTCNLDVGHGLMEHTAQFAGMYTTSRWGLYWVVAAELRVMERDILNWVSWLLEMWR